MRFVSIASGSSGNCIYAGTESTHILVDAGISTRRIKTGLAQLELSMDELDGILITHEHSDHIKGLRVFLKKYPLPLYASAPVLEYLQENVELPASVSLHEADPEGFCRRYAGETLCHLP